MPELKKELQSPWRLGCYELDEYGIGVSPTSLDPHPGLVKGTDNRVPFSPAMRTIIKMQDSEIAQLEGNQLFEMKCKYGMSLVRSGPRRPLKIIGSARFKNRAL